MIGRISVYWEAVIVGASVYIGVEDVLAIVAISFVDVVDCCDLSVSEVDPGACCNVLFVLCFVFLCFVFCFVLYFIVLCFSQKCSFRDF